MNSNHHLSRQERARLALARDTLRETGGRQTTAADFAGLRSAPLISSGVNEIIDLARAAVAELGPREQIKGEGAR